MATYEIPLTPEAQILSVTLAKTPYQFKLIWNQISLQWNLDIMDDAGNAVISGIPLVANVDLLEPYGYLNFGGKLVVQTVGAPDLPPTYENLGILGKLYFITS